MIRQRVLIVGDARTGAERRYEFLSTMLQRKYDVTVFDLAASAGDMVTFESLVRSLVDSLSRNADSASRAAVIGFGGGATVALAAAAEHPEFFDSLTLVAGWLNPTDKMRAIVELVAHLTTADPTSAASVFRAQTTSVLGWTAASEVAGEPVPALLHATSEKNLAETAVAISTPTLIIGCDRDEFASIEQSHQLFGAIVNARFTTISSGHDVITERPAELLSVVEPFVANPELYPAGAAIEEARP